MSEIATLHEVKAGLRIDDDDQDEVLRMMTDAATRAVLRYAKMNVADLTIAGEDEEAEPSEHPDLVRIRLATILLVGHWFRNRDGDPDGDFERGYLPKPVTALLYDMRDPTVA